MMRIEWAMKCNLGTGCQMAWYTTSIRCVERSELMAVAPFNPKICKKRQFGSITAVSKSMGENTSAWLGSSGLYELAVSSEKRSMVMVASERLLARQLIELS